MSDLTVPLPTGYEAAIAIPQHFRAQIPRYDTPITTFLQFSLPSRAVNLIHPGQIGVFSPLLPDAKGFNPTSMCIPQTAAQLQAGLLSAWKSGNRSILFSIKGVSRQLPLWMSVFWTAMDHALTAQICWRKAYEWYKREILQHPIPPGFSHLPAALDLFFMTVGWNSTINGPESNLQALNLADLFSVKWLGTDTMDHIIQLIRSWATLYPSEPTIFADTFDFQHPFDPEWSNSISWEAFDTDTPGQLGHVRNIAGKIRSGAICSVVFPLHDARFNHYVAAKLSGLTGQLFIGDSLGGDASDAVDARIIDGLQRFCSKLGHDQPLRVAKLSCPLQDDCFSCGVVTCNSIERQLFPHTQLWTPATKHLERVEWVLLLAARPGSQYSLVRKSHSS